MKGSGAIFYVLLILIIGIYVGWRVGKGLPLIPSKEDLLPKNFLVTSFETGGVKGQVIWLIDANRNDYPEANRVIEDKKLKKRKNILLDLKSETVALETWGFDKVNFRSHGDNTTPGVLYYDIAKERNHRSILLSFEMKDFKLKDSELILKDLGTTSEQKVDWKDR